MQRNSVLGFILSFFGVVGLGAMEAHPKLEALIREHQKQIPFKRSFHQKKILKEMNLELLSSGTLEVKAIGNAVWQINKPSFLKVEIEAGEVRMTSEVNAKPRVFKKSEQSMGGSDWMELLTKDPKDIEVYFDVVEAPSRLFRLTPKQTKGQVKVFDWVEFKFSAGKKVSLESLRIQENKDDQIEIKF